MKAASLVISIAIIVMTACSSEADPGEPCEVPGGTFDVCEPGTICGKPSDRSVAIVCIPICRDDKDCPRDYKCKGVEGSSVKGCRFED